MDEEIFDKIREFTVKQAGVGEDETPTLGYEVEFFNESNETIGVLTVYPDDVATF